MDQTHSKTRIGLLWRGDRHSEPPSPRADQVLGSLFKAFSKLPVVVEPVVFADGAIEEVREQLLTLDGVLVWVNPIQNGASHAQLDPLLREVSSNGVWVSAHPDVILKLGTKEVLFHTRHLGWGSETDLYSTTEDFAQRFPVRLGTHGRLVLKQGRGNGGRGVWKVELVERNDAAVDSDAIVRIQDAQSRDGSSRQVTLGSFMKQCDEYFVWSGCMVAQTFQERLADGMVRCYFAHDEVVGFCHQWPQSLLEFDPDGTQAAAAHVPSVMEGPNAPAYKALRDKVESEWIPQMKSVLGINTELLPVIWDADFLYGPKTTSGEDSFVLCEINVSAVWPFPSMASDTVAAAALRRAHEAKMLRK